MQSHDGSGHHLGREALVFAPNMVEDLAEMVLLADADNRIFYANPTASETTGYSADELVGLSLDRLFDADEELAAEAARCVDREASIHLETSTRRKDGTRFPAQVTLSPLRVDGRIEGVIILVIDVTSRVRAEQAVRLSRATLRSIDLAAPIGIGFVRDRVVLEINDRVCRLTGYSRDELIGRHIRMLYPSDEEYERVGRELYGQIAEHGSGVMETQWVRKDGTVLDLLLSSSAREPGKVDAGITITAMDITASKRSERAIRQSEATLRSIFLAAPIGIGVVVHRVFQVVNDRLCEMIGFARDELIGRSVRVIYPSQEQYDRVGRIKYGTIAERGAEVIETQWQRKDGRTIDILLSSAPLNPDDLQAGVTFTALDITEHKRAELSLHESQERFRNIVMCSPLGMLLYDLQADGRLVLVEANPSADRIFATDCRPFIGRPAEEVFPDLIGADTAAIFYRAAREGVAWGPEERSHARGSTQVTFETHVLRTSPGRIVVVIRDVTERKHLEDQLRQAQKMEAVGRLAGGVAHDFNNQLTVIKGYCDLLLHDTQLDGGTHEALAEIRNAAIRAAGLTSQLLAFSRHQVLRPVVLNLNDVIAEMENPLRRMIGEDIELRFVPGDDLGNVMADRSLVEQAVMNLVVNARDAMPQGGRITIETSQTSLSDDYTQVHPDVAPGDYVVLAVTDTGQGMDEATRLRIFEPFFTTKEVGKGTGLGLSMVYGFVTQSGGAVGVYSEPGVGSTLRLLLPRVTQKADLWVADEESTVVQGGSETILVVEDDETVRQLVVRVLRRSGYKVLEAGQASEAMPLGTHYEQRIHLLITDIVMPGMQGPELAERLKAARPDMKVLFVTGYAENAVISDRNLQPDVTLLTKPFEPAAVLRAVRNLLDQPSDG
ncbi:MAG: PAS domain S-box protein [Planctomycetes bacterium]|nr:PAS domain S-box protein [Planctomycetota bacterium]